PHPHRHLPHLFSVKSAASRRLRRPIRARKGRGVPPIPARAAHPRFFRLPSAIPRKARKCRAPPPRLSRTSSVYPAKRYLSRVEGKAPLPAAPMPGNGPLIHGDLIRKLFQGFFSDSGNLEQVADVFEGAVLFPVAEDRLGLGGADPVECLQVRGGGGVDVDTRRDQPRQG